MLDWSYALLGERERMILQRLSIFRDPFTLEAATSAVAYAEIATSDFMAGLVKLVLKSLVTTQDQRSRRQYALLDATGACAPEKLSESGEHEWVAPRRELVRAGDSRVRDAVAPAVRGFPIATFVRPRLDVRTPMGWPAFARCIGGHGAGCHARAPQMPPALLSSSRSCLAAIRSAVPKPSVKRS
jgi:hypothetical protein